MRHRTLNVKNASYDYFSLDPEATMQNPFLRKNELF